MNPVHRANGPAVLNMVMVPETTPCHSRKGVIMLSNQKGHDLIQHLKATANIARMMAIKLGLSEDLINKIYTAALFHDIGKCVPSFQKHMAVILYGTLIDEDFQDPINNLYPLHHEISWAYLTKKIGEEHILNAVYWHHARPVHNVENKKSTYDLAYDILEALSKEDIESLDNIWGTLFPLINHKSISLTGVIEVPNLFRKDSVNENGNAEFMLIRACVISADRHVSSLTSAVIGSLSEDMDKASNEVNDMLSGYIQGEPEKPVDYEQWRYNLQNSVIESIGVSRTTIIKAPAGLGKTLIGVLWSKKIGGKVIWVCPRNVVADAVYENIKREITVLGLSCTIELYHTGHRISTNKDDGRPEFSSDIIVTNIDAILSPMVNNGIAGRLFLVYGSNVVLDEFHEFVSDTPLFAAFITYMRARHRISNCNTLLLSATPSTVQCLWDTEDRSTLILPDNNSHYPPQHGGSYEVGFSDSFLPSTPGSLLVCNSVLEAQKNFEKGKYTHIIHHRYTETDRKKIGEAINGSFGKNKEGVKKGESLSAALVVQAAMDISFKCLYDSVCSPESTLQRIGRTDRWGTFQDMQPKITFLTINERTELGAINTVYDKELRDKWSVFLKQELKEKTHVTLMELYEIYNKFYQINGTEVKKYLIGLYKTGMNGPKKGMEFIGLVGFAPTKILNTDKSKILSSKKNLRNPDGSYFYTVEFEGQPNVWLAPENVLSEGRELYERYSNDGKLNRGLLTSGTMLTRLKGMVECGYQGWVKVSKGKGKMPDNLKEWFKKARCPDTPLPDFSHKYNKVLGVVKIK